MNRDKTKFFILGAGGQLGTEWVRFLRKNGYPFDAFSSRELDITDFQSLREKLNVSKPTVIINCAAYTKVDQAEDEPDKAYRINAGALKNLCELADQSGILFVHYSTDYVFPGLREDQKKQPDGYPEDFPADPINTYGRTKWQGEQFIRDLSPQHILIRVSWLCGASGNNFVKTMMRLCKDRNEISVVNDQWGSPTFTFNVVENTMALIENNCNGTYHITSKGLITWYDLTCEIVKRMKYPTRVIPILSKDYPTKAVRPYFSKLNTFKLSKVHGNKLIDWKDGLKELIDELKESSE